MCTEERKKGTVLSEGWDLLTLYFIILGMTMLKSPVTLLRNCGCLQKLSGIRQFLLALPSFQLSKCCCTFQCKHKIPKGALPTGHWLKFGSRAQVLTCMKSQTVFYNTCLIMTRRHSSKRFRKRKGRITNRSGTPVHILGYLQQSAALGDIYLQIWMCK